MITNVDRLLIDDVAPVMVNPYIELFGCLPYILLVAFSARN